MDNPLFQQLAQMLGTSVEYSLIRSNVGKTPDGYTTRITIQDVGEAVHIELFHIPYELAHKICQLVINKEATR